MFLEAVVLGMAGFVTMAADGEAALAVRTHVNLFVGCEEDVLGSHRWRSVKVDLRDVFLQPS
jgi:hypothetical protein